jgi:hypothetical protein
MIPSLVKVRFLSTHVLPPSVLLKTPAGKVPSVVAVPLGGVLRKVKLPLHQAVLIIPLTYSAKRGGPTHPSFENFRLVAEDLLPRAAYPFLTATTCSSPVTRKK